MSHAFLFFLCVENHAARRRETRYTHRLYFCPLLHAANKKGERVCRVAVFFKNVLGIRGCTCTEPMSSLSPCLREIRGWSRDKSVQPSKGRFAVDNGVVGTLANRRKIRERRWYSVMCSVKSCRKRDRSRKSQLEVRRENS